MLQVEYCLARVPSCRLRIPREALTSLAVPKLILMLNHKCSTEVFATTSFILTGSQPVDARDASIQRSRCAKCRGGVAADSAGSNL